MAAQKAVSEITVKQYKFGQPFPDLYSELENLKPLPKESLTIPGHLDNGMHAKFGVVLTRKGGFVLVMDGEWMEVSGPTGGFGLPSCIGRLPDGYKVEQS